MFRSQPSTSRRPVPPGAKPEQRFRVRWQDWSGHRPGQPPPKAQHLDFGDRAAAETHRAKLRARGPDCLVAIVDLGQREPPWFA